MNLPILVSPTKAQSILESNKPVGHFFYRKQEEWIAIDTTTGEPSKAEFNSMKEAIEWLKK